MDCLTYTCTISPETIQKSERAIGVARLTAPCLHCTIALFLSFFCTVLDLYFFSCLKATRETLGAYATAFIGPIFIGKEIKSYAMCSCHFG